MTRCAVYRHYDAEGALLYVGMSGNPTVRMYQHRSKTEWARRVARSETYWFDTREEAAEVERQLIAELGPAQNAPRGRADFPQVTDLGRWMAGHAARPMAEWASDFDVSRPFLYDLLSGNRFPSLDVALRIRAVTDGAVTVASWGNFAAVLAAIEEERAPPPAEEQAA
jgi:hypothetical protein